jgi:flagellar hook-basal body complex protein FliE
MSNNIGQINRLIPGLQKGLEQNHDAAEKAQNGKFVEVFSNMIQSVNNIQSEAARAQEQLAIGEAADLHQVMIAVEKAGIAMDLFLEVRNRLVEGYKTLIEMPM